MTNRRQLPAGWDPTPLATALNLFATTDTRIAGRAVFDFGAAGTVTLDLDLDPRHLTRAITDGLLAQLANLSLLAAHQNTLNAGEPTRHAETRTTTRK